MAKRYRKIGGGNYSVWQPENDPWDSLGAVVFLGIVLLFVLKGCS